MALHHYLGLCLLGLVLPLFVDREPAFAGMDEFPGWPEQILGVQMRQLPLTEREQHFVKGFPGKIGRFSDGKREVILRWVNTPSRKLHPAADCFKGIGYTIRPLSIEKDRQGGAWGRFEAVKGNTRLLISERIVNQQETQWTDVSAWYWSAVLGKQPGPWWAITVAETKR
ncbi:MAG: hypothetical protein OEZ39_12115 [Gammaproteobacteria bacterium]|nr:hypothetical protein [Gammaproteobacteria bacterium]MDH5652589.1 hypothetical protein [Gammaproteobacteria bacterium]